MSETADRMREFADYGDSLDGYEKGEAQNFCERLFQAFGHRGLAEAGAKLEFKVKKRRGRGTKFADLLWRPRVLIEMKSRGEKLERHVRQAFEYWIELVPERPTYVVLCNFDELWIYDFNSQLDSPVDRVELTELPERYTALNFLFPENPKPLFGNDKVAVTREAAGKVAQVFNALVESGEERDRAQRFILQCVVAMFAEDFDLLPKDLFTFLLTDCVEGANAYDVVGGLFRQMSEPVAARGGRYKGVDYFNGGLFDLVEPVELGTDECSLLLEASKEQWSSVAPPIFGTLFQSSMDQARRHALGAHFTSEADIQKVVLPTIVDPWHERIFRADTLGSLEGLLAEIREYRVLDPACGSGNFLYVAYRELVNLEMEILGKIHDNFGRRAQRTAGELSRVSAKQFFGLDIDPFAVELAKVTLMLGKRIVLAETKESRFAEQKDLPLDYEKPLPLDNLDENIRTDDALFCEWPSSHAIIGNPPYLAGNKMAQEYGREYVDRVRTAYPAVPGRADYCVYWFRRAHDELRSGGRAGLVGTNTVRENYSREGGLDYICESGGDISQAVSSQVWSGDADVHVSIVNWVKGTHAGKKRLYRQLGDYPDSPWEAHELEAINAALSPGADVTKAAALAVNADAPVCFQGQTHGHKGFLLTRDEAEAIRADDSSRAVLWPYLTGDDLLEVGDARRYSIDLNECEDINDARRHQLAYAHVEREVMPDILEKATREREKSGKETGPRQSHARRWWRFWRKRGELLDALGGLSRYIACVRHTKRPVLAFVSTDVRPNDALQVFALEDDYSFGVLQSKLHWDWFVERCSTLTARFRYTSNTVFDSFPWPQAPTLRDVMRVADASRTLRETRQAFIRDNGVNLRELYRALELPGENRLRSAHDSLDDAVRMAFGFSKRDSSLGALFELNQQVVAAEESGDVVLGPGLPPVVRNRADFVTDDCFPM